MFGRTMLFVATAAALVAASDARAQEIGQPQKGHESAQRLCAECHAVEKGQDRSPNANAPSFETIAAVPGMTSTALYAALQTSHRTMPNVMLERDQMADIVAYILSLQ